MDLGQNALLLLLFSLKYTAGTSAAERPVEFNFSIFTGGVIQQKTITKELIRPFSKQAMSTNQYKINTRNITLTYDLTNINQR